MHPKHQTRCNRLFQDTKTFFKGLWKATQPILVAIAFIILIILAVIIFLAVFFGVFTLFGYELAQYAPDSFVHALTPRRSLESGTKDLGDYFGMGFIGLLILLFFFFILIIVAIIVKICVWHYASTVKEEFSASNLVGLNCIFFNNFF
jgi:hypothetical protein